MRVLSCILLVVLAAMAQDEAPIYNLNDAPELFEKFIIKYNRHYKDEADREAHYEAFVNTLKVINKGNSERTFPGAATFGINEFADYTPEERKKMRGLLPYPVQHA